MGGEQFSQRSLLRLGTKTGNPRDLSFPASQTVGSIISVLGVVLFVKLQFGKKIGNGKESRNFSKDWHESKAIGSSHNKTTPIKKKNIVSLFQVFC
jgi:hypothetical protein